jgi:hypothetical protein
MPAGIGGPSQKGREAPTRLQSVVNRRKVPALPANHLSGGRFQEGKTLTPFRAAIYNHSADSGSVRLPSLDFLVPREWLHNLATRGEVPT